MNLVELVRRFPTDEDCRKHLEKIRWPDGPRCPKCGHDKITRLTTRKQFTCAKKKCRYRFSVTTGTVFHASHIPLNKWFLAVYLMSDAKKSVSSLQLHRELKVTKECCWHMCMRVREAMAEDVQQSALFSGIVQIDDYYHGGRPRPENKGKVKRGRGTSQQPIVGVVEKKTGRVRTAAVPNLQSKPLENLLRRWIDLPNTDLHSDAMMGYRRVGRLCKSHGVCDHSRWFVTSDGVHCNAVENAWSLFARGVMGAFHQISVKHLPRYLAEFDSRFNARHENGTYFERILRQADGRRLTMEQLVNSTESD